MDIGSRLKEERQKRKWSQADISDALKVSRETQGTYERGISTFDARYMLGLHELGFDCWYILTGERKAETLSRDESHIVECYRQMTERERNMVLAMVAGVGHSEQASSNIKIKTGKVGQVINGGNIDQSGATIGFISGEKKPKPSKK